MQLHFDIHVPTRTLLNCQIYADICFIRHKALAPAFPRSRFRNHNNKIVDLTSPGCIFVRA